MRILIAVLIFIPVALFAGSPQGVPVMSKATVGTSDTVALAANPQRAYLLIQNQGTVDCKVAFNAAVTGSQGFILVPSGTFYEPIELYAKTNIHMNCSSAGQVIQFLEGNW